MQKYKRLRGKPERAGRGWKLSVSTSPLSSLTGISSRVPQVGLWEPGEGRPSRRVLREPGDAIPRPLTWSRQVMRRVPLAGRYLPVGLAAKLAFDVSTPAFGYQESHTCNDATHEVLPGTPVVRDGYLWPSLEPGFGVNFDKKAASRLPPVKFRFDRRAAGVRRPDGSLEPP